MFDTNKKSTWNYRVMAHKYKHNEVGFQVHEVYYTNGKPTAYSDEPCSPYGLSVEELQKDYKLMAECIGMANSKQEKHKILLVGDDFPNEYEPNH